ncbi:MAG: hypothetical protein JXA13_16660 [Anaerolineales bacterium]|nr:hypothetical protein [Anaerolineales bacterium]
MKQNFLGRMILILLWSLILVMANLELYPVAWGTGNWLGEYSLKWAAISLFFGVFSIFLLLFVCLVLWFPQKAAGFFIQARGYRSKLGWFRYIFAVILLVFPGWFLMCTSWGIVFRGVFFRLLIGILTAGFVAVFLSIEEKHLISWGGGFSALLLLSSVLCISLPLMQVTDYPFSLGWSEGNRLWDYSILFGRDLYDYPADGYIPVYLDFGRKLTGGLPFLLPKVNIFFERLWVASLSFVPYLALGLAAFRYFRDNKVMWILASLFAYIFVYQGPIHAPLLVCAILVAVAWRQSLWIALPLVGLAGYFAQMSRFTWLFAPAMWIVMLEMGGASLEDGKLKLSVWLRAFVLGLSGLLGGFILPTFGPALWTNINGFVQGLGESGAGSETAASAVFGTGVTTTLIQNAVTGQPLLWYRLLPNATYGIGILIALFLAVAPLAALLVYLSLTGIWKLNIWQKLAVILPLLAFLVVGLVASTKIGGGGDLHNLDMFIIGLMFVAALAWKDGGGMWFRNVGQAPRWLQVTIILMLVIPAYYPLRAIKPISFAKDLTWVMTLTDTLPTDPPMETIPAGQEVEEYLHIIQNKVSVAASQGEILFIDQRQMLTFGYIDVPLVPEYEKKVLIDKAMGNDAAYFEPFYRDIAAQRFSMIVTSPLRAPRQDRSDHFGEENNAWVKWVTEPVLCYYEQDKFFKSIGVQLLTPKNEIGVCDLPVTLE